MRSRRRPSSGRAPPRPSLEATAMARRRSERHAPVALGLVRPRVLLTTEGTYPYAMGGVSSWCDLLVKSLTEFDWQVLPIVAPDGRPPTFALPEHAREVGRIEVWSEELPQGPAPAALGAPRRRGVARGPGAQPRRLGRRHRRGRRRPGSGAAAIPPACGAPFARTAAGPPSWAPCAKSWPSVCPRPGRPRRWTSSRPRGCTRRSTGSRAPRRHRRRTPTCCT